MLTWRRRRRSYIPNHTSNGEETERPINRLSYLWVGTCLLLQSACPPQSLLESRPSPWNTSRRPLEETGESRIQTGWWRSMLNSPPPTSFRTRTMQHPIDTTIIFRASFGSDIKNEHFLLEKPVPWRVHWQAASC